VEALFDLGVVLRGASAVAYLLADGVRAILAAKGRGLIVLIAQAVMGMPAAYLEATISENVSGHHYLGVMAGRAEAGEGVSQRQSRQWRILAMFYARASG